MPEQAQPAFVEIVERKRQYDPDSRVWTEHLVRPNEVRLNGTPLLVPSGQTIKVHDMGLINDDCVQVTLTLWARRVVMDSELDDRSNPQTPAEVAGAALDLVDSLLGLYRNGDTDGEAMVSAVAIRDSHLGEWRRTAAQLRDAVGGQL